MLVPLYLFLITQLCLAGAAKTYGMCGTQLNITAGGYGKTTQVTFDLSGITGEAVSYTYTDPNTNPPATFWFTPCGMAPETCVGANPAVGMGVRQSENAGGQTCDVLGSWSTDFAVWMPLLEDDTGDFIGLQLTGGDGSTCDNQPPHPVQPVAYGLVVNFNCFVGNPKDRIKAGPEASSFLAASGDACSPVYQINTCLACADGCALPLTPSSSQTGGGPGWFGWLLIIGFGFMLPAYIAGAYMVTGRLPVPFDRCFPESRRTSQEAGADAGYSSAAMGGTSYGSVSDSI